MKQVLLVLFFQVFFYTSKCQNIYSEKYNGCNTLKFNVENERLVESNKDSLLQAFISNINPKYLKKLKGTIYLQVLVDSVANPCCLSIKNESNIASDKLTLKEIVDTKTVWSIPVAREQIITVSTIIKLIFKKREISLTRLGYNGNIGWHDIETTSTAK